MSHFFSDRIAINIHEIIAFRVFAAYTAICIRRCLRAYDGNPIFSTNSRTLFVHYNSQYIGLNEVTGTLFILVRRSLFAKWPRREKPQWRPNDGFVRRALFVGKNRDIFRFNAISVVNYMRGEFYVMVGCA